MNDQIKYLITGAAIAIVCGTVGAVGGAWITRDANPARYQIRSQGPIVGGQPGPASFKPASFNGQPPAFNGQPPAFNGQPPAFNGQPPAFNGQPPAINGQSSVFNGQRLQPNPMMALPPRPGNGSNVTFHPAQPGAKPSMSRDQFQKAQDVPEVKAAREAFLEAQKKFAETVKKAVGSKPGAVASDSKSTPLSYDQFQKVQDVPEVKAAREVFLEAQKKFADSVKKAVASGPGRAVASAAKVTPVMLQTAPATSPGVASAPKNSLP